MGDHQENGAELTMEELRQQLIDVRLRNQEVEAANQEAVRARADAVRAQAEAEAEAERLRAQGPQMPPNICTLRLGCRNPPYNCPT